MRRKIQLDVDSLAVESFATTGGGVGRRGTVHGRAEASGACLRTLAQAECVSITGDLECRCVQTVANQLTCNVVCEGTANDCLSISGHLDCPCQLTG
jgi:hypothetical protein